MGWQLRLTTVLFLFLFVACPAARADAPETDASHSGSYLVTVFDDSSGFTPHGGTLSGGVWSPDFAAVSEPALGHSLSLFGKPARLLLKVASATPGLRVKMLIGSHFQSFERVVGVVEGGAQTLEITMPPEGWTHSGAEEDHLSHPLRILRISLEKGAETPAAPKVDFESLLCETVIPTANLVTLYATLTPDPAAPGAMTASCRGWNLSGREAAGTLVLSFQDWERTVLKEESRPWTLPGDGTSLDTSFSVTVPEDRNFADVSFRFEAEGLSPASARAGYTRPLTDAGGAELVPESPWGMGVFLYRYGGHPEGLAAMERAAVMARDAGVKWTREEFSWAGIETAPGVYDFSYYDQVVDAARRNGISVYGLLSYWGRFTEPYTEKGVDDFCVWARAVVRHFKDRVRHWEVYNEPNIFFWTGPKDLYATLLDKCGKIIKEEDPEALVLGMSTAGVDTAFIRRMEKFSPGYDILTVHPYRDRLDERTFMRELQRASEAARGRRVWITEMGWSTYLNGGKDEREQAGLLARCYLAAVASGVMDSMGWYDFRDDGTNPFYFEENFGVIRADMTPKPAYRALASVCRTLHSGKPRLVDTGNDTVFALCMGGNTALWSADRDARVRCVLKKRPAAVRNLMGEPAPLTADGKTLELTLKAGTPVFVSDAEPRRVGVLD